MENTKSKKLIIGVLLVLLLACLGVIVWQYIKLNTQNENNNNIATEKENVVTNNTSVTDITDIADATKKEEVKENNNDKTVDLVDAYDNYKDIEWSTTSAKSRTGATIEIRSNNNVYVTYLDPDTTENETKIVTGITGKSIKATSIIGGGIPFFFILTEEGKVYNFEEWDSEANLVCDLSAYNVIDMTPQFNKNTEYNLAFLTKTGDVIDREGNLLSK